MDVTCGHYYATGDFTCVDGNWSKEYCSPFRIESGECVYQEDCVVSPLYPEQTKDGRCLISVTTQPRNPRHFAAVEGGRSNAPGTLETLETRFGVKTL